jgi:hypothetical membrane protein
MLVRRERGELGDYVATLAKGKCKTGPNVAVIASFAGAGVGLLLGSFVAWRWGGERARRAGTNPNPARFQRIVMVSAIYYVIVCSAMHVLEPEYDPRFRFVSEYVWSPYGWLMVTTFFALGLAVFTVAIGLRAIYQASRSARLGFGLLIVGAVFVCLAGIFKDFIPHLAASAIALPSVVMAALFLSWSFRGARELDGLFQVSIVIALGMLIMLVSTIANVGMPGLQQRAFLLLFLSWLTIVARRLVLEPRRAVSTR